ncbi:MAG: hypothetical protein JXB17_12425 [Bacteroidales bacterium]|nr:hypothetical protein [Bacteroidales bacterium]
MEPNIKHLIGEIAFAMQMNSYDLSNYLKIDTLEVVFITDPFYNDDENIQKVKEDIDNNPENYLYIEPVGSNEAFRLMADFSENIEDMKLQNKLFQVLNKRRPFANFKNILQYYPEYLQKWYKYRNEYYENLAKEWLEENNIKIQ